MPEHASRDGHPDVAGYLLGLLPEDEVARVRAHVDQCAECARDLEELGHLPALLARAAPPSEPPEDLGRRVLETVRHEPRVGGWRSRLAAWTGGRPAGVARLRGPRLSMGWMAAAAVAAALLVVGTMEAAGVLPLSPRAARPAQMETVRLVAVKGRSGSGTAHIEHTPDGRLIELTVDGLGANPPGKVYVCWMVGGDGGHLERIAVGRFHVAGRESKTLRWMWRTSETGRYRLGITLEPDDGGRVRRGPQVLREV